MDPRRFNVVIVGCGGMGVEQLFDKSLPFTYSFAGAVLANPRANLVGLVDIDGSKLEQTRNRLMQEGHIDTQLILGPSLKRVMEEVVAQGDAINIVCCAGGPSANEEVIRLATESGVFGVYCEKPLALSLESADKLVELERKSGLKVAVNYLRNFDTCHLATIDHIRQGGIGDLLAVRVLYKGGVLAVAPHAFALLNHLFGGPPVMVSGICSPLINTRCIEDPNVDGVIQYLSTEGRLINVSLTATGRGDLDNNTYLFEFEFIGTKGRISILENGWRVRYERMEASRVFGASEQMPYDTAAIPLALRADAPREFMIEGLGRLISAIETGEPTTCNLEMARDAEETAHALALSAAGQQVINLPLEVRTHAFANSRAGMKLLREEAAPAQK